MSFGLGPCLGGGLLIASNGNSISSDSASAASHVAPSGSCQIGSGSCNSCSMSSTGELSVCIAPPGGPVPPLQPMSGPFFELGVLSSSNYAVEIGVTCVETGVTYVYVCNEGFLYYSMFPDVQQNDHYHFFTPGGAGEDCASGPHKYYSATLEVRWPDFPQWITVPQV